MKFLRDNRLLLISGLLLLGAIIGIGVTTGRLSTGSVLSERVGKGTLSFKVEEPVVINQPFEVSVELDTDEKNVNAAGVYLRFEPDKLQLLNLDTRSSFCQFYPERQYDNTLGSISLACGSPHPGIKGQNTLMTLKFMPVAAGETTIRAANESKLLLSDGEGTNILMEYPVESIRVVNSL